MAGGEYRAEKLSAGPISFPAGGHPPWNISGYDPVQDRKGDYT
jgi:hypothetical protein